MRSGSLRAACAGVKAVFACAVGISMLAMAGCDKPKQAGAGGPPPPTNVNVATAISEVAPIYLDEIGKTVACESVTVMPQVAGMVWDRHFKDGADLTKGELLFTLDARPFVAALHQAEGQLAKDQAASANADSFLRRQEDIYKKGFVTPSDYDVAVMNSKSAQAAIEMDKALVEVAKLNVEYCKINSPINGRAGQRLVDPGNIVKINETPMLVIERQDPIYADFTINEAQLASVREQMAKHVLKAYVKVPNEPRLGREGSLTFLDNAVQDASGTIKLRATLPNADRHFWPGQFINVHLILEEKPSVLVPTAAMQLGQQGPFIYVVNPKTIAEIRPVVVGQRQQGELVVIDKGVMAGEKVIVNGQVMVFPGAPVNVVPSGGAPVPQGTAGLEAPDSAVGKANSSPPTTAPALADFSDAARSSDSSARPATQPVSADMR